MSTEIKTPNLEEIAANYKKLVAKVKRRIIICGGTGCIANGSMKVRDAICAELEKAGERPANTSRSSSTATTAPKTRASPISPSPAARDSARWARSSASNPKESSTAT